MYTNELFKQEIKIYINKVGYDPSLVAKFAYKIYEEHIRDINSELREKILDIANIDMGPEFELSEEEFNVFLSKI